MRNVLEWLETAAQACPDKLAVADESTRLTFAELEAKARAIGSALAGCVHAGEAVALYAEKSADVLAAMLGTAYAGGFYSLIDTRQPKVRVEAILAALSPAAVITDAAHAEAATEMLAGTGYGALMLEELAACPADDAALAAARAAAIDTDPLYCNFTSGSTGTPKGVLVSHRSVIDFIPVFCSTLGIGADDVIANQAPFDFDVSVKDIYSMLCARASMHIIPREYFSTPTRLMDYLCDREATTLIWAVSAMCFVSIMNGFGYRLPEKVSKVMFSGEVMPPKQLRIWQKWLPDATYVNLYGPTEITCNCTYHVIDREYANDEVIPMGKPFANERVFLLDEDGALVTEPGEQGEICVSGTALGLGYLGDAERTAASFCQNPLNKRWLEPIYRTGDLGRFDEDGNLVYVSRKDHQIKHMGHRIELGDIEAAAMGVDGVERTCCLYDSRRKKLRLFYVGSIEKDALAEQLHALLPSFMVPNAIRQIDAMPLTKNGKIDRNALANLK